VTAHQDGGEELTASPVERLLSPAEAKRWEAFVTNAGVEVRMLQLVALARPPRRHARASNEPRELRVAVTLTRGGVDRKFWGWPVLSIREFFANSSAGQMTPERAEGVSLRLHEAKALRDKLSTAIALMDRLAVEQQRRAG
jgi:hypothetical protein